MEEFTKEEKILIESLCDKAISEIHEKKCAWGLFERAPKGTDLLNLNILENALLSLRYKVR